ncbi:MAG: hypothetical protein JW910_00905 [Anaerolineae bacterium]|nr:hypothetical protein [Anaerolineae bacterium]
MRRHLFGIFLISGLALLSLVSVVQAQGGGRTYVGAGECRSCHQGLSTHQATSLHALALQDVSTDQTPIVADFSQGEAVRTVTLPGAADARPFTADDVAYAVGAGRYTQRYLVAADDGYLLLPAQWNAHESTWEPFTLAESWPDAAYAWGPNCAYCHTVGLEVETFTWLDDGVRCEACHGPGSEHVALAEAAPLRASTDELAAIRGAIYVGADAQVCGQCHSAGTDGTTGLPYPVGYRPGDELLAGFTLVPPEDHAAWWPTGHGRAVNMQFSEWVHSGHSILPDGLAASDMAQDACLSCHSADYNYAEAIRALFADGTLRGTPPEAVTVETAQFAVTCITCHSVHSEADFFITSDDVRDDLCVACHSNNTGLEDFLHHPVQEMIEGVTLVAAVPGIAGTHFTAENGPDCLTCHMPRVPGNEQARVSHALTPVVRDVPAELETLVGCTECHTGFTAAAMQTFVDDAQTGTLERLDAARAALNTDSPAWVEQALDFVAGDGSLGVHNYLYTDALLDAVETELALVPAVGPFPEPVAPPDVVAEAASPPPAEVAPDTVIGDLTLPGVIFLGVVALILVIAAYAFLIRGGDA